MIMKTSELNEKVFPYNYLRIDTSRIDRFLAIADEDFESLVEKYSDGLQQQKFDQQVLQEAAKAARVGFSLYALAISDCASILENNRAKILKRITNPSINESTDFSDINKVNTVLKQIGIQHKLVRNYHRAEEFRSVSNHIKHARFAYSETIEITRGKKKGKVYTFDHLRELYKHRVELQDYLKDLFDKINAVNQG